VLASSCSFFPAPRMQHCRSERHSERLRRRRQRKEQGKKDGKIKGLTSESCKFLKSFTETWCHDISHGVTVTPQ
jgi:hypothetical protein